MKRKLMFGRENGEDPSEINHYQTADDQLSWAREFLAEKRTQLILDNVHPWHAPDLLLVKMGLASLAFAQDVLAEETLKSCIIPNDKKRKLTPDGAQFSLAASEAAADSKNLTLR
jgi:hypothetical protein